MDFDDPIDDGTYFGGGENDRHHEPGMRRFIWIVVISTLAAGLIFGLIRDSL